MITLSKETLSYESKPEYHRVCRHCKRSTVHRPVNSPTVTNRDNNLLQGDWIEICRECGMTDYEPRQA